MPGHLIFQQIGAGFALTSFENLEAYDFSHSSRVDECSPEFGSRQMKYRACIEISGDPIRALRFNNVIAHPLCGPALHIGKAWDLEMVRCYYEARGRRDVAGIEGGARGSVRIFGPKADMLAETGLYATGSIDIVGRTFWPGINGLPVGTRPSSTYRFRNMDGLWNTRDSRTGPAMEISSYLEFPGIQDIINDNRSLTLQGAGGGQGFRFFSSTNQLRIGSNSVEPLQIHRNITGDALSLLRNGAVVGALAMSAGRMRLTMNAEAVTWSSSSGSPNGQIAGPVGGLWTRTDGGAATTLYVKESGTGNTGWRAV